MALTEVFVEPKSDLPEHYAAIGRLIEGFSNIERALTSTLREILGLTDGMGRAITGEMRARELMQTINRILDAKFIDDMINDPVAAGAVPVTAEEMASALEMLERGETPAILQKKERRTPDRAIMRQLFSEIEALNKIRDDIAHRRLFVRSRDMMFTNSDNARTYDRLIFNYYSIDDLNEAADYSKRLTDRVHLLLQPPSALAGTLAQRPTLQEMPSRLQPEAKSHSRRGRQARRQRQRPRHPPSRE